MRAMEADEQELITALELEAQLNKARKKAGQLSRDIFDLQYRIDLSEGEKTAEQELLRKELAQLLQTTPISIELLDKRTIVTYITEEEISDLVAEHGELLDVPPGAEKILEEAQQRYTMKTKLYRARLKFGDGQQTIVGVVEKTFAYGKEKEQHGTPGEVLIEIIPKTVAPSAQELTILTDDVQVLLDDSILQFPAGDNIVYYVTGDISLSALEDVRTILVPDINVVDNGITGYSIFGMDALSGFADRTGISLSVLIALLVAAYLSYYFGLVSRVKYFFYQGGPKTKLHYVRVLLNDVHDTLAANNYDKALMMYKEIKLTYDQLSTPAKNELFEEITMVCAELDKSFMKRLIVEMDTALKHDQLEQAIEHFARIEATYERLPQEEQRQVHDIVLGLGKRLGLEASA
jgi:hypothetical protein